MIEFYIDRQIVDLEDVNFTLEDRNPLMSNVGPFSLGMEIPLSSPRNKIVYHFINKTFKIESIETKRSVVLIIDGNPFVGQEDIMSYDEATNKVSITTYLQTASFDLKLKEQEKKTITDVIGKVNYMFSDIPDSDGVGEDFYYIEVFLYAHYPAVPYCLPPTYRKDANGNWNIWNNYKTLWTFNNWDTNKWKLVSGSDSKQMPFLFFVVDLVLEKLGLPKCTVPESLRPYYERMYIVHNSNNYLYRQLPNWTVNDFFKEIEKLFGARFIQDSETSMYLYPTVSLSSTAVNQINDEDVLTTRTVDFANEAESDLAEISRLGVMKFTFPENDYYKLHQIPSEKYNLTNIVQLNTINDLAFLFTSQGGVSNDMGYYYMTKTVWHIKESGHYYTLHYQGEQAFFHYALWRVDMFRNTDGDENANVVELKITPAEITRTQTKQFIIENYPVGGSGPEHYYGPYFNPQIPSSSQDYLPEQVAPNNWVDSIVMGDFEELYPEKLEVAMYAGMCTLDVEPWYRKISYPDDESSSYPVTSKYPMSYNDIYRCGEDVFTLNYGSNPAVIENILGSILWSISDDSTDENLIILREGFDEVKGSIRLLGKESLGERVFQKKLNIDLKRKFIISFIERKLLLVGNLFIINNKRYLCALITRNITGNTRDLISEGEFYELI